MSTIEEAREQAREALPGALARLVENRIGRSLAREADKDMIALRAAANAIVALLDATEPPTYAEFHDHQTMDKVRDALLISGYRDVAGAIHHMQNAGILFRERKQVQADKPAEDERDPRQRAEYLAASRAEHALGQWRGGEPADDERETREAAEPMRDADGDMISSGEHRKISMSGDSFFVCDTCTNVLGLNVRWDHASKREDHQAAVEPLPVKPAEDEREALVEVIRLFFQNWRSIGKVSAAFEVSIDSLEGAVDDLIELGAPRPITDEMVLAALNAHDERNPDRDLEDWTNASAHRMRLTLEAAEEARR